MKEKLQLMILYSLKFLPMRGGVNVASLCKMDICLVELYLTILLYQMNK